jgi:parvulin-like peptidyl-prolyl isomerase
VKRSLGLVVLALLVVLPACGNRGGVAARVNGEEITVEQVRTDIEDFAKSDLFVRSLKSQGVNIEGTKTLNKAFAAQWLTSLIQNEALAQIAARRGIEPTAQQQDAARAQFTSQPQNAEAFRQLPARLRNQLVRAAALQIAVGETLTPEVSDEQLQATYQQFVADCPSNKLVGHILVGTPEEAQAVVQRVDAGESFATVAAEVSTDQGSSSQGGLLTCEGSAQWEQFDPTFRQAAADTATGTISAPVQTQFGWHVIEALPATIENARPLLVAALSSQNPLGDLLGRFLSTADVTVDPRFGTFSDTGGQFTIVPQTPREPRTRPPSSPTTTAPAGSGASTPPSP